MVFGVVLKFDGVALDDRYAHEGLPLQEITDRECFTTNLIAHALKITIDLSGQCIGVLGWKQRTRRHPGVDMRKGDASIGGGVEQHIFI